MTIGAYDGVHLGHRALLGELRARAQATACPPRWSPSTGIRPPWCARVGARSCSAISTRSSSCWSRPGVDRTVVVPFDDERANETAEDFVEVILVDGLDARLVVVGEDFHFGHGRKGNVALLREMGAEAGFAVEGVSAPGRRRRRRSPARAHLVDPDPQPGRPPAGWRRRPCCWAGPTRSGARWSTATTGAGAELGFPTANVDVPAGICLPAAGIYAGLVRATGRIDLEGGRLGRPPPDLLRGRRRPAGGGLPARLLRRPLR